jgi:magnesium transporter
MSQGRRHDLEEPLAPLVQTDCARLNHALTVGQALEYIRANPPTSRVIYFYVVDDEQRLQGVVPTRRLLLSIPETPIKDIMVRNLIALPDSATILDACEFFAMHKLLAFPVVDANRRLLGIVDVELYTEELSDLDIQERSQDLFQLAGVKLAEARTATPWAGFRQRFPWLICNIIGGMLAVILAQRFEWEQTQVVALAWFIPIVLALSESVTIQSVSLAIQSLHGKKPNWRMIAGRLRTELSTGFLLGLGCAISVGVLGLVWVGKSIAIWSVVAGILGGVSAAALIGMALPYVLKALHREPHVAAGPLALTTTDLVTLGVYFSTARWLLG